MSSPGRVLTILDLFSSDKPVWNPDQINSVLGYSRTTGYRYVKELVDAGFLQKVSAGLYSLGPRIIELDYQLRQSDPLLLSARPVMAEIAAETGYDAVLSMLYLNAMQIIDIYRANVQPGLELTYGRGRPRPLLISSAPKVLLSHLKNSQLRQIYECHQQQIEASDMGPAWEDFRGYLKRVKKRGYYVSYGELEPKVGAIAVPVINDEGDAVAALALVGDVDKIRSEESEVMARKLQRASTLISDHFKACYNKLVQNTSDL